MKYAWVDAQRREYPLPDMCEVLAVSISGCRAWRRGGKPDRTRLSDPQARNFAPEARNRVWTGDITCIHTGGKLAVPGPRGGPVRPREVVGCSIRPRMTADIATDALSMPWFRRKPGRDVIFHSDRGSQYASQAMTAKLVEYGMAASMSRKGNRWDNAPTGSFFNSLKNERMHGTTCARRAEARADLFEYVEVFLQPESPPLHAGLPLAGSVPGEPDQPACRSEQSRAAWSRSLWKTKFDGRLTHSARDTFLAGKVDVERRAIEDAAPPLGSAAHGETGGFAA